MLIRLFQESGFLIQKLLVDSLLGVLKKCVFFRLKKMESQLDNVEEGLKEKKGKVLKEIEKVN